MKVRPKHKRDSTKLKHPHPWRVEGNRIKDASGHIVCVVDCPAAALLIVHAVAVCDGIDLAFLKAIPAGSLARALPAFEGLMNALREVQTNENLEHGDLRTLRTRLQTINVIARAARAQAAEFHD